MELIIRNKQITAPIAEILNEVKRQLTNGKLREIKKEKHNNILISCPRHKEGLENHASCQVYSSYDSNELLPGTTHCLRAGTKVPTKAGIKNIEDLVDKPTYIINGNGEWESTVFKQYGTAPLVKISLCRENINNVIYCTADHEWFIGRERTKKLTSQLCIGEYLSSQYHYAESFNIIPEAVRHGIIYADGSRNICWKRHVIKGTNRRITDYNIVPSKCCYRVLFSEKTTKTNLVKFFNTDDWTIRYHVKKDKEYYTKIESKRLDIKKNLKEIPDFTDRDYIFSFLAGYFACDGSIMGKSFSSTKYIDMLKLRDLFVSCGVSIRNLTTSVRESGKTYLKDRESILYTMKIILETLPDNFFINDKPNLVNKKYIRGRWRIADIEYTDNIEPVYCCSTSTNSFVIDENILTHNCFVCDYKATLPKLIADLFDEEYEFGEDWLLANFGEVWDSFQYLPEIKLNNKNHQQYLDESILDRFNQYNPYIEKRGIDIDIARKFKVGYDAETDCITFPVWDEHDKLKMITKRSTKGKMFYIDADIDKPVYLLNEIIKQNITTVYVTESQIDALNLWSWGYPAIALIGLGSKNQYEILNKSGIRSYILCLDNDIWGEKGRDRFRQNIRKDIFISDFRITNNKKDINDLTKEEFESMLLI